MEGDGERAESIVDCVHMFQRHRNAVQHDLCNWAMNRSKLSTTSPGLVQGDHAAPTSQINDSNFLCGCTNYAI